MNPLNGYNLCAFVSTRATAEWRHKGFLENDDPLKAPMTLFDIFVRAVAQAADQRGVLGDDEIVFPPEPDFGYESTPRNALTFGAMGVDGVHYAILKIEGAVTDESPVIHVSPMDFSEPYAVLGETFLAYLSAACDVTHSEMEGVFAAERTCGEKLVPFLKAHFDHSRLYSETRLRSLDGYLRLIEKKSFPHQVAIPEGGLVARPSAMHQFCTTHALPYMTRVELRGDPPSRYIRFCFDDPAHADAFLAEFGGERTTTEP